MKARSHDATEVPLTLAQMGLTKDESSRYQKLAAMPENHFEAAIATAKAAVGEVTTARMLREAVKQVEAKAPPKPSKPKPITEPVAQKSTEEVGGEQKPSDSDNPLGDFDPLDELQRVMAELDEAHALIKAAEAQDSKAEVMKWKRAYDHAQREHSAAMERAALEARLHAYKHRQLMRCGRAVGEDNPEQIAPVVEALARRLAANVPPEKARPASRAASDHAPDREYF